MTASADWSNQPLPLTVVLYHHETIDAYIRRLALKNRLDPAAYPQVVALTRMLASPHWLSLPLGSQNDLENFLREVRRTVAPQFNWTDRAYQRGGDPLVNLFLQTRAERQTAARS